MNYNYTGSLAQRFIRLRSGVVVTEEFSSAVFDSVEIFVPSTLAADNLVDVDLTNIKDMPVVKQANVGNFAGVLKGDLLTQWRPIFADGANSAPNLIIVVFYVPEAAASDTFADYLTVTSGSIDYAPLTKAFDLVYASGFFKMMFSPRYDCLSPVGGYDDQFHADLTLALALLCLNTPAMSYHFAFMKLALPLAAIDTNPLKILSKTDAEEMAAATALNVVIANVAQPRTSYFWGMLNLLQASNTWLIVHSEPTNLVPAALGLMYLVPNASGTYLGNKLSRLRLSASNIKPMGVPSILDSSVNTNMSLAMSEILDKKNVAYAFSVADGGGNDAVLSYARGITGTPVCATLISKFVDYYSSQYIANMIANVNTAATPVLKNEATYTRVQEIIVGQLQRFARSGRLTGIVLNFPAYGELPASDTDITVAQGWQAQYVDDIDHITVAGLVVV